MKNSHPNRHRRIIPVMISEMEPGTPIAVFKELDPLERPARSADIRTIANGLSWESHATVMAVNPFV